MISYFHTFLKTNLTKTKQKKKGGHKKFQSFIKISTLHEFACSKIRQLDVTKTRARTLHAQKISGR